MRARGKLTVARSVGQLDDEGRERESERKPRRVEVLSVQLIL